MKLYSVTVSRCIACGKCELACAFAHGSELLELGLIAAHEHRHGHDIRAVAHFEAALFDDGEQGTDVVLIGAHPACDAVQDDADLVGFHDLRFAISNWPLRERPTADSTVLTRTSFKTVAADVSPL